MFDTNFPSPKRKDKGIKVYSEGTYQESQNMNKTFSALGKVRPKLGNNLRFLQKKSTSPNINFTIYSTSVGGIICRIFNFLALIVHKWEHFKNLGKISHTGDTESFDMCG